MYFIYLVGINMMVYWYLVIVDLEITIKKITSYQSSSSTFKFPAIHFSATLALIYVTNL